MSTSAEPDPHIEAWIRAYYERGWTSVIPLPGRSKRITDSGLTGADGTDLPVEESVRMAMSRGWSSMALRLPVGVLGIDVDGYTKAGVQKQGFDTLQWLEDGPPGPDQEELALGPLPPTWISTSRTDGSGIRMFRVPEGIERWKGEAGRDVELISHGYRYAVTAPSEHEDGKRHYRWAWGSTGDLRERAAGSLPRVDELALLPDVWVEALRAGTKSRGGSARLTSGLSRADLRAALAALPPGPACVDVERVSGELMRAATRALGPAHNALLAPVGRMVVMGLGGCPGAGKALLAAREAYEALPDSAGHAADFDAMLLGALDQVLAEGGSGWRCSQAETIDLSYLMGTGGEPAADVSDGTAGSGSDETAAGPDHPATSGKPVHLNDAEWWERRIELVHIRHYARARMLSPAAVLGGVICRALCLVPHTMTLPAIVGSPASLNFWVALVGEAGDGKSAAMAVAEECIKMGTVTTLTPGTGEGIAASFVRRGDPRKKEPEVVPHTAAVHFTVGEVETLTALGGRSGTTLWSELRKTWSGEALGFANRDPKTRLPVAAHSYRLTMSVGVQPTKAGPILDDVDAGMPQRFLWLPTGDPTAPDELPDEPAPMAWAPPWGLEVAGATEFGVDGAIWAEIREIRRERRKGKGDRMAGHRALTKLKLAAALAVLAERVDVTLDDWALAEDIMASSDAVRGAVEAALAAEKVRANRAQALAKGFSDVTRGDVKHEAAVTRVCRWLRTKLGDDPVSWRDLSRMVASRDRPYLREAMDLLVATGDAIEEEADSGRSQQYREGHP